MFVSYPAANLIYKLIDWALFKFDISSFRINKSGKCLTCTWLAVLTSLSALVDPLQRSYQSNVFYFSVKNYFSITYNTSLLLDKICCPKSSSIESWELNLYPADILTGIGTFNLMPWIPIRLIWAWIISFVFIQVYGTAPYFAYFLNGKSFYFSTNFVSLVSYFTVFNKLGSAEKQDEFSKKIAFSFPTF